MQLSDSKDDLNKNRSDQNLNSHVDDETKTIHPNVTGGKLDSHHPKKIGQYIIRRVIASGGMGTVFEALQDNPRRTVAIKVIKGSDVSEKAVSRLKYEAQMLARLRHPGIAEIYEAGTYEDHGTVVPFFAMEYIPNAKTITEYAKSRKLTVEERLDLFTQVCDAVNYGHQRGIVHRDLKPDNVLVDSHNRIRIIDFGLARATDSDLHQTNVQTEVGQIIGSLQYMSPEQFEADSRDLDTRSDVYSLGVVLFELLSGSLPYNFSTKKVYEIANIVREKQPLTLNKSGTKVAVEIDIILQKCLRKERELRYQTAYGLQQDISRYLSGDAIVARSPSLAYQIKVFTRKNKLLVSSFASALVLLIAGSIVSTTLLVQVSEESEKAMKANTFLANIFETAVPIGYGEPVPIKRLLDRSTEMLEDAFPDDPEIEADIMHSLGIGYFFCEEFDASREHLNHALSSRKETLGETHPKTRETLKMLSWLNSVTGEFSKKLAICEEICRIDSIDYGLKNENALYSKLTLAFGLENVGRISEALKTVRNTRELYLSEKSDNIKLGNIIDQCLSWFLLQSGSFDEAEEIARTNLELATTRIEESRYTLSSKSYLAAALIAKGKLDEAMELYGNFPTYPTLDREYDFQGDLNPDKSEILLIVFWEEWCPYCDRRMRKLDRLYREYHKYGIDMVGVTRINKTSTKPDCEEFLRRNDITFPAFKESGKAFSYFNCTGVPSTRLVYKGKLIWEHRIGSTQLISRHMLEGIVKALKSSVVSKA
jgi:serine/threonine protein kinase/thiol-disulfide isomerase/thioredoxin